MPKLLVPLAALLVTVPGLVLAAPSAAAYVDGSVGGRAFSLHEATTLQESLANTTQITTPSVATFGPTGVLQRIGFQQSVIFADGSALELALLLPPETAPTLAPGTLELGGTTIQSFAQASNQGWSGECPDLEEDTPVLTVSHYAAPGPNTPALPGGVPMGDLQRQYQTHHTRIQRDSAKLHIRSLDRVGGWIEAEASGQVSYVVPKDSDEVNDRKPSRWMCRPAEFSIQTEPFELRFRMKLDDTLMSATDR